MTENILSKCIKNFWDYIEKDFKKRRNEECKKLVEKWEKEFKKCN